MINLMKGAFIKEEVSPIFDGKLIGFLGTIQKTAASPDLPSVIAHLGSFKSAGLLAG